MTHEYMMKTDTILTTDRYKLVRHIYDTIIFSRLGQKFEFQNNVWNTNFLQECLLGMLKEKTVLYVTHQVEFLPAADLILVIRKVFF